MPQSEPQIVERNIQCPLCNGRGCNSPPHDINVPMILVEFAALFDGEPKIIGCPLCYSRGQVTIELASAFLVTESNLMRRIDIFAMRRSLMPRSQCARKYAQK